MRVSELLEQLEDAAEAGWGDAEVRLALHPRFHPFSTEVSDATSLVEGVFYICEGGRLGYLSDPVEGALVGDLEWGADQGL